MKMLVPKQTNPSPRLRISKNPTPLNVIKKSSPTDTHIEAANGSPLDNILQRIDHAVLEKGILPSQKERTFLEHNRHHIKRAENNRNRISNF
jgi:ribosomal protein S21